MGEGELELTKLGGMAGPNDGLVTSANKNNKVGVSNGQIDRQLSIKLSKMPKEEREKMEQANEAD